MGSNGGEVADFDSVEFATGDGGNFASGPYTREQILLPTLARRIVSGETEFALDFNGLSVSVRIVDDADSTPADSEIYTPDQVAAWHAGGWRFVGVELGVYATGVNASGALFGVERGMVSADDEATYLTDAVLRDLWQLACEDIATFAATVAAFAARVG